MPSSLLKMVQILDPNSEFLSPAQPSPAKMASPTYPRSSSVARQPTPADPNPEKFKVWSVKENRWKLVEPRLDCSRRCHQMTIDMLQQLNGDLEKNKLKSSQGSLLDCRAHGDRFRFKVKLNVHPACSTMNSLPAFCIVSSASFPVILCHSLDTGSERGLFPLALRKPKDRGQST